MLLDTGPLVAYLYPRDAHHTWAVEQFTAVTTPFITCEAVLTEACFLALRNGQSPVLPIQVANAGAVRVGFEAADELAAIQSLMVRYANVPMSFADACLVRLAETTGLPIYTLDADFEIYRARRGRALDLIMPPSRRAFHEP